ncbi:MAG TPA: asparaginase [bacterium]|nr:asparaginase [bacterium]
MGKILVLFSGGTLSMAPNTDGVLAPSDNAETILKTVPGLREAADCDFELVCNIDSSNMQPEIWADLAQRIARAYDRYDGFVIAHGTDTMAYTASALSFALGNLGKPVVLTGSQKPLISLATDGINNLINAVRVAQMDLGEVCIVFGTRILQGNRSTKESDTKLNAFRSPIAFPIGEIEIDAYLRGQYTPRHEKKLTLQAAFENRIVVFQLFPGMEPDLIERVLVGNTCKGIVMLGFGPGNIPNGGRSLIGVIEQATAVGIPVLVTTQCSLRRGDMRQYLVGFDAVTAGAISALDMTDEAAITKFMWVLAQTQNPADVKRMMQTNYAGELTLS